MGKRQKPCSGQGPRRSEHLLFAGESSVCPPAGFSPPGTEGAGSGVQGRGCISGPPHHQPSRGPSAPSSSLPGGHRQPQAPSSAGYRMCAPRHVLRPSAADSPPPPQPRRQHAGLNTQGRMSRPGAPTDVLSPWAGGAGLAGGPPNEAEGPQARVVAAAVWAEPVGCLALSHCRGFT